MFIGSGGRRGRAALVFLAALMVAGTLGGAAAYLVNRGKAGIPGGPRLGHADELRLVPGTAVGFIHVRWRDARRAPGAADLRQIIEKASPHAKAALDPSSSLDPATIDRVTVVYLRGAEPLGPPAAKGPPKAPLAPNPQGPPQPEPELADLVTLSAVNSFVVLTFTAPYNAEKVRDALAKNSVNKKIGDREYTEDAIANVAVYCPDDTTLVLGDADRMAQFLVPPASAGPLTDALERAAEGGRHVAAAFDMGLLAIDMRAFGKLSPHFQPLKEHLEKVAKVQSVSLEVAFGDEMKVEYRAKYRTDALADDARAALAHIADHAREHSGDPAPPDDAPRLKAMRAPPEVLTKLIAPTTLGRLDEWLAGASVQSRDAEVVIVPKERSAATVYAALAGTSGVLFKPAEKQKAAPK